MINLKASVENLQSACARNGIALTQHLLIVSIAEQAVYWIEARPDSNGDFQPTVQDTNKRFIASTSKFGIGQVANSNCTPLGLHSIAEKVGGDQSIGTVFKSRIPVGNLNDGVTKGSIVHRILWLKGLEPGLNQGGAVDTFSRFIYIHGFDDETTLGKPASHGCIHLAAADLIPLYDTIPEGTLVWIER